MKTRDAVLEYQRTCKDTETFTKDLDLVEPISAIEFEVECTNGATSNLNNFISDIVTKIELVDGSDVLESLNMSQLEALHFYKTGKMPCIFPSEWAGGIQRHNVSLFFGRYLWDPQFAFLATKFKNPQLKVTFNKAAIRAAGDTGFASGDNIKLTEVAKVFEDGIAPTKFLMQKQIDSFTSAASGEKRIEFPIDYTYRMLLLRFWLQLKDIDEIITDIKLTCDTDKFIPFNRKTKQLDAYAFSVFGSGRVKHDVRFNDNTTTRLIFNKEPDVRAYWTTQNLFDIIGIAYQWSSEIKWWLGTHAGVADTTVREVTAVEEGHAPHATVPIFFGRPDVPEDWFNPTAYKKVELVLTQATADATCEIVLEQVRPL